MSLTELAEGYIKLVRGERAALAAQRDELNARLAELDKHITECEQVVAAATP